MPVAFVAVGCAFEEILKQERTLKKGNEETFDYINM